MKVLLIILALSLLLGCSYRSDNPHNSIKEKSNSSTEIAKEPRIAGSIEVSIDVNPDLEVCRFNDADVVSREKLEYNPDSDVIKNIAMFSMNEAFFRLFSKPAKNLTINLREIEQTVGTVSEILSRFDVLIDKKLEDKIAKIAAYRSVSFSTKDISIYMHKNSSSTFRISRITIFGRSNKLQSELPIGSSLQEVEKLLGKPLFYKNDGSVYIYNSFNDLIQLNVLFDKRTVSKLQYILWDGI